MRFDTLHALVAYVEALPRLDGDDTTQNAWAGYKNDPAQGSHEAAAKLATYGWPEGARMASERAARIAERVVGATGASVYQTVEYDVIGAAYDAGAVALGQPEAWGVLAPQPAKRAVRIVLNCSVSAGVPAESITKRGLAVCALALALQARGYPVTVDVWQPEDKKPPSKDGLGQILVRVADASTGSQLDLDRVVYALSHPTMFRRLMRAVTNGLRTNLHDRQTARWDWSHVAETPPDNEIDLYLGGAHLVQVERWRDGGEAWIVQEYLRQTGA